ncbi:MAG: NmrA family NAD(P)-binding protein [Sphingobacterium sp.]|jgi:nucleoside-diphosphate-sugar epimerase|nr:NmrA family NAD(P)-binding protein [Sphingobacterium sp.]
MKITVTGSLGNISKILTEKLVGVVHNVSVITSQEESVEQIQKLGATAVVGKLDDDRFIGWAFKNADAVYKMIPPSYETAGEIIKVGSGYVRAIIENNIPYVVNLSGIGAHLADGPGPAGANFHNEKEFNSIQGTNVLHLRPGLFYSNFYGAADMIRQQHIIGNNFGGKIILALSHSHDIAQVIFEALHNNNFSGKSSAYAVSAEITGYEITNILGRGTKSPDLKWIEFTDQVLSENLLKQGKTPEMAHTYNLDMGITLRNGGLLKDYFKEKQGILAGASSFEKFAEEFTEILF